MKQSLLNKKETLIATLMFGWEILRERPESDVVIKNAYECIQSSTLKIVYS